MRPAFSRPHAPAPKRLVHQPEKAKHFVAQFRSRFRIEDRNRSGRCQIAAINALPACALYRGGNGTDIGEERMGSLLMKSWKTWLLIAAGTLTGLVAGAGLGRYVLNVPTTPVEAVSPATPEKAANNASCFDNAGHKVTFVTVEPRVQLEVLDWGGNGDALVLLTGSGDNAHVFDQFAYQFTDRFHVIGITRRGYGRSSQPAHGYDLDTRARDNIAVLDKLNIRQAIFVGHSIAGTELSKLGAVYPDRVKKLVYLDALDIGSGGWANLPQPPPPPELTPKDLESVQRLAAALALEDGYRKPLAAICNMIRTDPSGRVLGPITPPEISRKIQAGLQPAQYDRIQAPALGIFSNITLQFRMAYYSNLKPAQQEEFNRSIKSLSKWVGGAIQRFRSEVKNSRVVELRDTNHYVFIVDEALVVREMRKFLLEE
jgi:pimeloyl-ACP methyl ester carboxylesterase